MSKAIEIDGVFYRRRRGKLVAIPEEWVGQVTHPQTKRKLARVEKKAETRAKKRHKHKEP